MKSIVIVAGEASGDLYGACLIKALKSMDESIFICGMGGRAMRASGAHLVVDSDQLSVMGISEALAQTRVIFQARSELKNLLSGLSRIY